MPEFDSEGVRLHYELAGPEDGEPVVLVHGFASDYQLNWVGSRWQETLAGSGRLVVGLDCRGHGSSEKPHDPEAYARTTMAADVDRLLRHLDVTQADYLGYSMGARIGLDVLVHHGQRIRRAVLGGLGIWRGRSGAELIARRLRGDTGVEDPQAEIFYRFASARPENDLEALACCILGPQPLMDDGELGRIRIPVAIMAGDRDLVARNAPELAAQIPGAHYVAIEGRDHMTAVPARQFKQATQEFLSA